MDTPSLVSLPVEIVLLIAELFFECRDVLSLMRVYLGPRGRDEMRPNLRFEAILFCNDARVLLNRGWYKPPLMPGPCWAIMCGDVELTRTALSAYEAFSSAGVRKLFEGGRPESWKPWVPQSPNAPTVCRTAGEINQPNPTMLAVLSGNADMLRVVLNIRTRETIEVDEQWHFVAPQCKAHPLRRGRR
jgi:hypothetical protein